MTLLLTMLPVYLMGNLHCMGMCGPLVLLIGRHRFRYFYFLGRLLAFGIVGAMAGEAGSILHLFLKEYYLSSLSCFIFGGVILLIGLSNLSGKQYPGYLWFSRQMARMSHTLSLLMLRDKAWPTFLFGFFTISLPCGQTVMIISASALSGDLWFGFLNGFIFALLTSPSLFLAMHAHVFLSRLNQHYNVVMGLCALIVGMIAICRGLADINFISHLVFNPFDSERFHFVIY